MDINKIFLNNNYTIKDNVYVFNQNDLYTSNFGHQWKDFQNVQIDSLNNNEISYKFLKRLLFNNEEILKDKIVLEIGCGAGRFTEYLVKKTKLCVSVDLSSAILYHSTQICV